MTSSISIKIIRMSIYPCFHHHIKLCQAYSQVMLARAMLGNRCAQVYLSVSFRLSHWSFKNTLLNVHYYSEYASQPISFNESDFKRRSLNETMQNERDGVEVPFQPDIIDFNGAIPDFCSRRIQCDNFHVLQSPKATIKSTCRMMTSTLTRRMEHQWANNNKMLQLKSPEIIKINMYVFSIWR